MPWEPVECTGPYAQRATSDPWSHSAIILATDRGSSCSNAMVLPLPLSFFCCGISSLGPLHKAPPSWFLDGARDFGDIAMKQWNKCVSLHHNIFLILTSMCMCTHICVWCVNLSFFIHKKGTLILSCFPHSERELAIQSFGIVNAWGPEAFSHIYLEKRSNSGCSQSWAVQGFNRKGRSQGIWRPIANKEISMSSHLGRGHRKSVPRGHLLWGCVDVFG